MGMSDQYDDGRYDGLTEGEVDELIHPNTWPTGIETEVYNRKTDQWLPGGDPRLPKYRGVEHGSYPKRTPKDQRVRSTKGTTVTQERLTKAQIEHELRTNTQLMDALRHRRSQLQEQAKNAIPAEPPQYTMFSVTVRFKMRGKRYQFLVLRTPGGYFTTGKDTHGYFPLWEGLMDWLEGPDVYDHTNIEILQGAGKLVSFDTGRIENEDPTDVPF